MVSLHQNKSCAEFVPIFRGHCWNDAAKMPTSHLRHLSLSSRTCEIGMSTSKPGGTLKALSPKLDGMNKEQGQRTSRFVRW